MRFLKGAGASLLVTLVVSGCAVIRPSAVPSPTPLLGSTPTQSALFATPTPTPTVPAALTSTPTGPLGSPVSEANIVVTAPTLGQRAKSPLRITGRARVFEASLKVRLRGPGGAVLAERTVTASAGAPEWGEFSVELAFVSPGQETSATLEVFSQSPRDGSVINLVGVSLTLLPP